VPTDPTKPIERLLVRHLPYELDMLEQTLVRLLDGKVTDRVLQNALIESFWTHARNLIEFFNCKEKGDGQTGVASAQDMTTGYAVDTKLTEVNDLINKQISHLQYDRPAFTQGQLDYNYMYRVREIIGREMQKFQKCINHDYKKFWVTRQQSDETIDKKGWLAFAQNQPTATNVIQVNGPTKVTP
jgi:hypothetical protein